MQKEWIILHKFLSKQVLEINLIKFNAYNYTINICYLLIYNIQLSKIYLQVSFYKCLHRLLFNK